jgi:hypothetical protein
MDVYKALDEIVVEMRETEHSPLADAIHSLMHEVAWTTGSELLGELRQLLNGALSVDAPSMPTRFRMKLERVRSAIDEILHLWN